MKKQKPQKKKKKKQTQIRQKKENKMIVKTKQKKEKTEEQKLTEETYQPESREELPDGQASTVAPNDAGNAEPAPLDDNRTMFNPSSSDHEDKAGSHSNETTRRVGNLVPHQLRPSCNCSFAQF